MHTNFNFGFLAVEAGIPPVYFFETDPRTEREYPNFCKTKTGSAPFHCRVQALDNTVVIRSYYRQDCRILAMTHRHERDPQDGLELLRLARGCTFQSSA